ncbi:hypothetical protein ABMA27_011009 [Loxostege sticticalis]|uniref:Uncharacterized protein n=1 Tax=Loxostege sticticalis TaxID=481309 RepID=A0ABR3H305_LOXSC
MFTDEEDEDSSGAVRYPCMPSLVSLQQMRNRLHLAYLGRKLMKWTTLATGRELRRLATEIYSTYNSFGDDIKNAFMLLARARYFYPNLNKMVTENCPHKASVVVGTKTKTVSGVKCVIFEIVESGVEPYVHLGIEKGGQQILEAKIAWLELLKRLVLMTELRKNFALLEEAHRNATNFHWCAKNNETKNENSCPICAKKAEEFKKTNECPMCSKKSESKAEGCPMCAKKLDKSETEKICPICKKLDEKKGCPVCEKKSEQPSMSCPLCNKKIENCPICSMKKPEESSEKDDKKDKIDDKELQHTCKSCDGKDMKNACPICGAVEAEKAAKEKARSECPYCGKAKPEGSDDIKNKDKNSEDKKEPELKHSCKFCDISKDKKESCAVCTAVEDEEATTQLKSLCDFCGADKSTEKEGTCPSCAKLKECKICKERLAKKNICPLCLAKAKSAPDTSVSGDFFHRVDSLCPSCKKGDNKSKSECKMCLENAEKHKAKDICQICGPDPDKLEVKPKEIPESPCSSCKAGDKKSETPCKMCEENVAIDKANKEPKCTCAEKKEESTYKKGIESKCSCQKNKDQDQGQELCPKCGRNKSPKPAFKFSSLCDYCKEEYTHKKPSCLCGESKPAASSCLCKHCQEVAASQEPPGCPICAQKSQKSLCFFCADNKSSKSSFQVCGRPFSEKGRGKVCSFDPSLGALSGTDSNSEESCCDSNKSFGIETEACVQSCDYSYKSMSNVHEVDDEPICCSTQTAKKTSLKSCCSNNKRPVGHTCCFSEPKSCPECRIRVPMADASTITKTADRYDVRPIRLIAGARGTSDTTVKPLCCCKPEPTRLCNCKSEPIYSPFIDKRNIFKSKSFY